MASGATCELDMPSCLKFRTLPFIGIAPLGGLGHARRCRNTHFWVFVCGFGSRGKRFLKDGFADLQTLGFGTSALCYFFIEAVAEILTFGLWFSIRVCVKTNFLKEAIAALHTFVVLGIWPTGHFLGSHCRNAHFCVFVIGFGFRQDVFFVRKSLPKCLLVGFSPH